MATIVFCDDDPSVRKLVMATLRSTGHENHMAVDGGEGLELIERLQPDAVFTDVSMPVMTGVELAEAVKRQPQLADIPIIAVTASVQRDHLSELSRCGITDYIRKPFIAAALREKVNEVVARRNSGEEPQMGSTLSSPDRAVVESQNRNPGEQS